MLNQPRSNEELESGSAGLSDLQVEVQNPFPGLRPFSIDECHLFFGREGQTDEILNLISINRFVTVLGYSGSGKSSLMTCGLIPVLYGGFVTDSGPFWNIIITRPGSSPLGNLVDSLAEFLVSANRIRHEDLPIHKAIINSVLRSGPDGLVEVTRYIQSELSENVFILVDQFEEIFRLRDKEHPDDAQNDAKYYVNLFIRAVQQRQIPIYAALTMRSDFIGECATFPGLTQLINNSNYLVPQLTREQKKLAIEGPIAVAGGKISQRLVKRLLNEMGNDQDQLPILQHALMRTWDYWLANREPGEAIDIRHYSAVGRIAEALSQHANEIYDELNSKNKQIAEVLFKSITERSQENRGMRKPCVLGLIAQIAEVSESEVIEVVEAFRKPGRSFLMPAANIPLTTDSLIELSHESLMRIWNRLEVWVADEFDSASMYKRLSDAAAMYQIGKTGLWRPPDLQLALNWQKKQKPTREWAHRYDEAFERAIVFLDTSRITYEAELKNQEMMQRRVLRRTRVTAVVLGIAFLVAILFFVFAYIQKLQADQDRMIAEQNRVRAEEQTKIAEINRKKAEEQTDKAEKAAEQLLRSNEALEDAVASAQRERDRAEELLHRAVASEQRAIKAGENEKVAAELAELKAAEATYNYQLALTQYMLTKAQELASKAAVQDDDKNLAGLLAMQGYLYHRRYHGKKYDPYIYQGLYSALTKVSGGNYNAMKIQGPPRVHMRSLAIAEKKNALYTAGADGRIYEGQFDKLTNHATSFSTPYPSKVIALSKDESYLVNGSDSAFVQIYNMRNGIKPLTVKRLSGSTNDIEFLPDDSGFIVAGGGKTLTKVNHKTGESSILVTLPNEPKTISISPDGKSLVAGTWAGQIFLVNLGDNTFTVFKQEAASRILSVQFSPSGNLLAYGLEDTANKRGVVRLHDFSTGETRQFSGHRSGVNDVEFSPDEKLLASAGLDKRLQLYVLENPNDLPVVMDNNNGYVWDIEFAQGSSLLIAACSESEIRVWPTDPTALSELICPELTRNMTQDEWEKFVGDQEYENTCVRLLIKDY